jgi:tryptophan synthase beta subunit
MLVRRSLVSLKSAYRQSKRTLFFGATPRIRPFSAVTGENDVGDASGAANTTDTTDAPGLEDLKIAYEREALPVTFSDISRANVAIRSGVKRTTCEKSYFLSELLGANIFLKTEFRQFTGSFKERGARNALFHHIRNQGDAFKETGAIAASAGNHALALAYHGQQLGIPVTVVMPTVAPLAKVDKCRKFGARIIIEGG